MFNSIYSQSQIQEMHQLCIDAYTGTGGFYDKSYLCKFSREERGYEERKEYSDYENQVGAIVDSLITPVFANDITREDANALEEGFIKDCDGAGTTLDEKMQEIITWHSLLKNVFVVIDNYPKVPNRVEEALEKRQYPYIYYKLCTEVHDYSKDKHGKLTMIEFYYETIRDKMGLPKKVYRHIDASTQYDFYFNNGVNGYRTITTEKIKSVSKSIPVIMTGTQIMPIPAMYDLCVMAKTVFNKSSELRHIERNSNFSILQIPGMKPNKKVVITNTLYVDDDSTRDAKWLSPDSSVMTAALDSRDRSAQALNDIAKQYGAVPIVNGEAKSGVAYAYEFSGNTAKLKGYSNTAEDTEEAVFSKFAEVSGLSSSISIAYDKTFTPGTTQLLGQLEVITKAIEMDVSPTATKLLKEKYVEIVNILADVGITEKQFEQISTEIAKIIGVSTLAQLSTVVETETARTELDNMALLLLGVEGKREEILEDVIGGRED